MATNIRKVLDDDPDFRVEPGEVITAFDGDTIQEIFIVAKLKTGELEVACSGNTEAAFKLMEEFKIKLDNGDFSA